MAIPGGFGGLVGIHQHLIRNPEANATGNALHPGHSQTPERWTPTFYLVPYHAIDRVELGLGGRASFHDIDANLLNAAIRRVVDVEGPVHFQVLADRLLTAADVGRLGSRIRARIEAHLDSLQDAGELLWQDEFIGRPTQFLVPRLRDWSGAPEKTRDLDHVHNTELMLCLFHAVLEQEGADADTVMNDGLYRIGFVRLTTNARNRLQAPLQALIDEHMVGRRGDRLFLAREAFLRR
ncbi:DUF3320 domain-containing protein [Arhodomonas sp. AD133]|uniref:DUF3320 domain-containing protein n=1 Tax=Arhodomonas sp. AD133 TaxID=3415009 RepID=UPI003EB82BDD